MRSRRGDDPAVLTLTEAGLLAKIGFNEAGIGLVTNFLLSDRRRFGMPIHVTRRKVLATRSLEAAIAAITDVERAHSANYLLGSADGRAVNVEAWPEATALLEPEDGVLAHANHFRRLTDDRQDLGRDIYPDSARRDGRLRAPPVRTCRQHRTGILPSLPLPITRSIRTASAATSARTIRRQSRSKPSVPWSSTSTSGSWTSVPGRRVRPNSYQWRWMVDEPESARRTWLHA